MCPNDRFAPGLLLDPDSALVGFAPQPRFRWRWPPIRRCLTGGLDRQARGCGLAANARSDALAEVMALFPRVTWKLKTAASTGSRAFTRLRVSVLMSAFPLARLPVELVVEVMHDLGARQAARFATANRWLRQAYLHSSRLDLEAYEYRTGYRVVNTADGAEAQRDRIKAFADAAALSTWHEERVISLGSPVTEVFECHGTVLYISGGSKGHVVHVEQLGCPLRNVPSRSWQWTLPSSVNVEDGTFEYVMMDPGESTVMFVSSGSTEEGALCVSFRRCRAATSGRPLKWSLVFRYMSFVFRDLQTGQIAGGLEGADELRLMHHSPDLSDPKGCYCLRGRYLLAITNYCDTTSEDPSPSSLVWVRNVTNGEALVKVLQ